MLFFTFFLFCFKNDVDDDHLKEFNFFLFFRYQNVSQNDCFMNNQTHTQTISTFFLLEKNALKDGKGDKIKLLMKKQNMHSFYLIEKT